MKLFLNFLRILLVCLVCSAVPFLYIGIVFGAPAYILSSILITLIFRKELS